MNAGVGGRAMEGLHGHEFFSFEAADHTVATYSDEDEDEESSGVDSGDDSDADEERDVQKVLEDMFHRMPCGPSGWLWQDEAIAQEKNGCGGEPGLHYQSLPSGMDATIKLKQEVMEERMPRWGHNETRELISIRGSLEADPSFSFQKKNLWDPIAGKMRERGYSRTSEQCKRKWKKLASRYKEKETIGLEKGRKFLFFADMDEVFRARLQRRVAMDTERKDSLEENQGESDQLSEDADSAGMAEFPRKKRRMDGMQQVLSNFIAKQQGMEKAWQELLRRKQRDWQQREEQWMRAMEKLQQQRMAREAAWRDREEQRRVREEIRAQKWDKMFALLLDRLKEVD